MLLNRVGRRTPVNSASPTLGEMFGYADSGFRVTLDDSAPNGDIHLHRAAPAGGNEAAPISADYSTALSGTWAPDGRITSPVQVVSSDPRPARLEVFNGLAANGGWTLQVIDFNSGGTAVLTEWGLNLTGNPVPEPTEHVAVTGLALLGFKFWRRRADR